MSKRILSLVLALAMLFTMSINVLASPAFTFFSMVSPTEAMVGRTVTVQIKAEPQTDLSKMNVTMPFDPDILEYAFHEVTYDFPGLVDVNVGEDYIALNQNGSTPYFLQNTTFLKVTFNVLAPYENYEFTLDLENCFTMACEPNGDGTYDEYELEPRMNEDFGGPSYTTFKAACVEHDFVLQSGEPSCTGGGYSYERCSNCNESRNYTSIPALGHSCEDGYCVRCGEREGVWVSGSHNDHLWELLGDGGFGGTLVIKPEEGLTDVKIEDNDDVSLTWHEWNLGICSNATSIVIEEGVSRIGAIAFHNMDSVETVELPSTLTSIGRDAFKDCRNLQTVIYNGEVWEGIEIADGNDKLIEIVENGGSGNKYGFFGENATWELNEYGVLIIFGNGELSLEKVQYVLPWASYIEEIQRIVIGEGITSVGRNVFRGHRSVSTISLPESLEVIGERAFYQCRSLAEINIPANVRSIESDAFAGCRTEAYNVSSENAWYCAEDGVLFNKEQSNLVAYPQARDVESYTIPSTVNEISDGAFRNSRVKEIVIPNSVRVIGIEAFFNNNRMTEIHIPADVETIGDCAFSRCLSLESINVDSYNENYCSVDGVLFDKEKETLLQYPACKEDAEYTVPDSVYHIGAESFANNEFIESIHLPGSLVSIGNIAFDSCTNLTDVYFHGSEENWATIEVDEGNDCLLNANIHFLGSDVEPEEEAWLYTENDDDSVTLNGYKGTLSGEVVLPSEIDGKMVSGIDGYMDENEMYHYAFENQKKITSIVIPDTITAFTGREFKNCSGLRKVTIPASVIVIFTGDNPFEGCDLLEEIVLEQGSAFRMQDNMLMIEQRLVHCLRSVEGKVTVPKTVEWVSHAAFENCKNITEVEFTAGNNTIGVNSFNGCTSLEIVRIPESVKYISEYAFNGCTALSDVYYAGSPMSWEKISVLEGNDCLLNANIHFLGAEEDVVVDSGLCGKNLTWELTKAGTLTISGEGKMTSTPWSSHKKEITAVIIEDGVTNIPEAAFKDCYNIKSAEIGADVEVIGAKAFYECESLTEITIPAGVVSISDNTFTWCEKLETVTLPEGLETIGENAFKGCYALKNMEIPSSVTSFGKGAFADCRSLESITIPEEMTEIPEALFENCRSLNNVVIPNNVTSIGKAAFNGCHKLDNITLPEGLETIGEWAFSCCYALEKVTIPASVEEISRGAFNDCDELAYVYFGGSKVAWEKLTIGTYNEALTEAIFHFDVVAELPAGDANGDTKIDSADVNFLYRAIMDYTELTEAQAAAADVNDDGKVNSADVNLLYRYVMGYVDAI